MGELKVQVMVYGRGGVSPGRRLRYGHEKNFQLSPVNDSLMKVLSVIYGFVKMDAFIRIVCSPKAEFYLILD